MRRSAQRSLLTRPEQHHTECEKKIYGICGAVYESIPLYSPIAKPDIEQLVIYSTKIRINLHVPIHEDGGLASHSQDRKHQVRGSARSVQPTFPPGSGRPFLSVKGKSSSGAHGYSISPVESAIGIAIFQSDSQHHRHRRCILRGHEGSDRRPGIWIIGCPRE